MRPRATILVKLLVAFALPTLVLFGVFAIVAYQVARDDLDAELGGRLTSLAQTAASQVRGKYLVDLQGGQEDDRGRQNALRKLEALAEVSGARFFVFDRQFESRLDTQHQPPVDIGTHYYRAELDRLEVARVLERGVAVASVTFEGSDGRSYKTAYAPVRRSETEPEIVLALGAEAPATYFVPLADLQRTLLLWGGALVAVVLAATFAIAFLVTRNVRRLAAAAERIGQGELRRPIDVRGGDEIGVLAQTMDRMRGQLAERDARTQQMLAGIAHEVRNPLAGMTLFTGILRDELPDGDERRGHVEKIARELGYLERVVTDFLEFARRPKPSVVTLEVADLLAEVAQLASTNDLAIAVEPAGDLVARADRAQLRRALLNLGRNAVQAATAAGHTGGDAVRLSARRRDDAIAFSVWNRGVEIAPETSGRMFEPFYTTREKGTGLGLAFVREIAIDHGGKVEVESAGGETTFTIVLPAA